MQPIPLLLNRKAGILFQSGLKRWLSRHQQYFRILMTESPAEALRQTEALIKAHEPIVAAAGGDGTLMNVAQALLGSDTALGILPSGSMNVFARELGIGSHRYDIALAALLGNERKQVDIFKVNEKPFLQLAGFGTDADIVKRVTPKLKRRFGPAAHLVTAIQALRSPLPKIHVRTDTGEILSGAQVVLGNGACYGGGAHLFRRASYEDGKLDAVVINGSHIGIFAKMLFCMLQRGALEGHTPAGVSIRQFRHCVISANDSVSYQLDGDYVGELRQGEEMLVERMEHRLQVCVPPSLLSQKRY